MRLSLLIYGFVLFTGNLASFEGSANILTRTEHWLRGDLVGYPNGQLFLLRYNNSTIFAYEVTDSLRTDSSGHFELEQPAESGMYRLCIGMQGWYNSHPQNTLHMWLGFGEDITFHAKASDITGTAAFTKGRLNNWWTGNERALQPYLHRLGICMQLLDIYPRTAKDFYGQVRGEYLRAQQELKALWTTLGRQQTDNPLFALERRQLAAFAFNPPGKAERTIFLRQHFLDSIDFSSTSLQNSHLAGEKLEQYLEQFGYPYGFATREAMDSALMPAIDGIFNQCENGVYSRGNAGARIAALQFAASWLYRFCSDKGLDNCLAYSAAKLTADVFANTCHVAPGSLQVLQRMRVMNRLQPGAAAPDILLQGPDYLHLADIHSRHTLLVFWASWCPHCQQALPAIKKLCDSIARQDLQVLAVSVDTSRAAWSEAILREKFNCIHYCDTKGWNGPAANDYGVYSTPQMFLLDEHKRIVGRPGSVTQLQEMLGIRHPQSITKSDK